MIVEINDTAARVVTNRQTHKASSVPGTLLRCAPRVNNRSAHKQWTRVILSLSHASLCMIDIAAKWEAEKKRRGKAREANERKQAERGRAAKFNSTSFAKGRFRRAYKGTWTAPACDEGTRVVKECKANYTWKPTDWNDTVKITEKAAELAKAFNSKVGTRRPIKYFIVHVMRATGGSQLDKPPKRNEYLTCEDYIPGDFQKWCNNYGYIDNGSLSLPAFMHWSWYLTDGELMVADLQGVRKDDCYLLTDPAIMSLSGGYGATDTGVEGMVMFFLNHTCNSYCDHLPKPSLQHFRGIIPHQHLEAAKTLLAQVQSTTTYRFELKFPEVICARVAARFRQIAKKNI